MIDLVKKITASVEAADAALSHNDDKSSQGSSAKDVGQEIMKEISKQFVDISFQKAAIEIPYILYCGLRNKVFGNTYIFPYIVQSGSTVIN